jgi:exodeoxyribonuclease V beta subunit
VQGAHRGIGVALGPVAEGRDLDVGVESLHPFESASSANTGDASGLAGGMDRFPRGAQAGTLLHQVLEETCLSDWHEDEARALARNALSQAGLDSVYEDSILHVIESVARTPLRGEPSMLRLGDLPRAAYRPEMEFTLSALGGRSRFEPGSLSDLFRAAGPDSVLGRYADRVRELGFRELQGYLRGFIDAVFFDGERYFLLDYKSNHLGARQADYRPENLIAPMIEHDYVLQYLIYSVALDRHLARTLDGYRYETHFGGVYYLFLRGLAVSHEPGCGVFFDRPEGSVLHAVSSLLGEAA